jgi:hypothetical protein
MADETSAGTDTEIFDCPLRKFFTSAKNYPSLGNKFRNQQDNYWQNQHKNFSDFCCASGLLLIPIYIVRVFQEDCGYFAVL